MRAQSRQIIRANQTSSNLCDYTDSDGVADVSLDELMEIQETQDETGEVILTPVELAMLNDSRLNGTPIEECASSGPTRQQVYAVGGLGLLALLFFALSRRD